jgi:hypothetical protein
MVFGLYIWPSEVFQRKHFPKKFWSEKVEELENSILSNEYLIEDFTIELIKKKLTLPFDIAQEMKLAETVGLDVNEAREKAKEAKLKEIEQMQDMVKLLEEELKEKKALLGEARDELSKYQ